ncbi:MAG: hypothetical protein GQ547_02630 [Methylophaga sp.]|nr:hypothetical protein [Methylophaga sp.]
MAPMDSNLEQLLSISSKYRKQLQSFTTGDLAGFSGGTCDISSIMLGHYLYSQGFENIMVIYAVRWKIDPAYGDNKTQSSYTHTWLKVNNHYIVDITADQFPDCKTEVIVTTQSNFHDSFEEKTAINNILDETIPNQYIETYQSIDKELDISTGQPA